MRFCVSRIDSRFAFKRYIEKDHFLWRMGCSEFCIEYAVISRIVLPGRYTRLRIDLDLAARMCQ